MEPTAAPAVMAQVNNAELTAELLPQLAACQRPPRPSEQTIPGNVAAVISKCVGPNYLGQAGELRLIAARVNNEMWDEFFRKELVPAAQRGLHAVHLETGLQFTDQEQPYIALGGTMPAMPA